MNAFKLLSTWFGSGSPQLREYLQKAADSDSDFAPQAREMLAKLDAAGSPVNLGNVAVAVVAELKNIGQGKFDGRRHPGDVA